MVATLRQKEIEAQFTVSTGAYSSGDVMGTANAAAQISDVFDYVGQSGTILEAWLFDPEAQAASKAMDAIVFNANPSGSTLNDNGAINIVAADITKIQASFRFATDVGGSNRDIGDTSYGLVDRPRAVCSGATRHLWVVMYTTDTPDWVAGVTLTLRMKIVLNG